MNYPVACLQHNLRCRRRFSRNILRGRRVADGVGEHGDIRQIGDVQNVLSQVFGGFQAQRSSGEGEEFRRNFRGAQGVDRITAAAFGFRGKRRAVGQREVDLRYAQVR